jgi:hypothetical protein
MTQSKIFLSSTFLDLSDTRKEMSRWLSGVFGADLIIMETFGSDTTPPDVASVRRVSECDTFIGIYAHRYGSIDPHSGKSITELELDEAKHALSLGIIKDLLLYVVEEGSSWASEHAETEENALAGLRRIKQKAKQHTYTIFKEGDDLLFYIVRDLYKRVFHTVTSHPPGIRSALLPSAKIIKEPLGMEFLTSADRDYLFGRGQEAEQLFDRLQDAPIVLLLGDSGVGKTSLIHAGIIPRAVSAGMRPIYTRPLGFPAADITQKIHTTVFEGSPRHGGALVPLLAEVTAALKGQCVLLIIDQFEDVLSSQDAGETLQLISALRTIHEVADPTLRVVVSYRSDLEGRLGKYWQGIAGSPKGLTRQYLNGIQEEEAWTGIRKVAQDLNIPLKLKPSEENEICKDLSVASKAIGIAGIYPPYIQIMIEHLWSSTQKGHNSYQLQNYQEAGGMEGVIGKYLNRLLQYAQDDEGHIRAVLIALVRSYGIKAQRTMSEILADTGLSGTACETALEILIDLRLVRHIDPFYEVSHDYVARKIINELADSQEREFKRFRELLASKAAAYQTTSGLLSEQEVLMLFKHKEKVLPTEPELRLLLATWILQKGPGLYWLLKGDPAKLLDWLRSEESKGELGPGEKASIILLRRRLGESPLKLKDFQILHYYKFSAELSYLIVENPLSIPDELLMYGIRHRRDEVRHACSHAIAEQIKAGRLEWIEKIRRSNGAGCKRTYLSLVLRGNVLAPKQQSKMSPLVAEFSLLKELAYSKDSSSIEKSYAQLIQRNLPKHIRQFVKGLSLVRRGHLSVLLKQAWRVPASSAEHLLAAVFGRMSSRDFGTLVSTFARWNSADFKRYNQAIDYNYRYRKSKIYRIATALAEAINRCMDARFLPKLRQAFRTTSLTPASRGIVLALLRYATSRDIELVLKRLAATEYKVDIWNHTELGVCAAKRMELLQGKSGLPKFLSQILTKTEFWEYIHASERSKRLQRELLPIQDPGNKGLYVRLAGYSSVGAAGRKDVDRLLKLSQHYFGLLARAAAMRLVRIRNEDGLRRLSLMTDDCIEQGTSDSLADSVRYAEMELYGLVKYW